MKKNTTYRAFTLIELLVVIAIIALLIGILLPALGRAREAGRTVVCMTRIRELGLSMNMYADSNDDRYAALERLKPSQDSDAPTATSPWYGWVESWQKNLGDYVPKLQDLDGPQAGFATYDKNFVFNCPNRAPNETDYTDPLYWDKEAFSYAINHYMTVPNDPAGNIYGRNFRFTGQWDYKRVATPRPSYMIVLGDAMEYHSQTMFSTDHAANNASPRWMVPGFRHGADDPDLQLPDGRTPYAHVTGSADKDRVDRVGSLRRDANMLMNDGHVETLSQDELGFGEDPDEDGGRWLWKPRANETLWKRGWRDTF